MSLDGFIAGPGGSMEFGMVARRRLRGTGRFREVAAATGAMLIVGGRGGGRPDGGEKPGSVDYPSPDRCSSSPIGRWSGRTRSPHPLRDIGDAVATALDAAGGKDLEIFGADVAGQCLQRGLVDEILVYVLPVLFGDGIHFSASGVAMTALEPISSNGRRRPPCCASASARRPTRPPVSAGTAHLDVVASRIPRPANDSAKAWRRRRTMPGGEARVRVRRRRTSRRGEHDSVIAMNVPLNKSSCPMGVGPCRNELWQEGEEEEGELGIQEIGQDR